MRVFACVALIGAGAVSACASPVLNSGLSVALKASPETAICDVHQNGQTIANGVTGSSTIRVPNKEAPLAISCAAPGFETLTTEIVAAAFKNDKTKKAGTTEMKLSLKPIAADATTQVDCAVAGLSLKMSVRDCQNMAGAEVERYYEVPLVQAASLEWSGVMPPNWRATGKPLSLINTIQ